VIAPGTLVSVRCQVLGRVAELSRDGQSACIVVGCWRGWFRLTALEAVEPQTLS
jgi:hypothetical protein